jgi:NADP-dependent 3-hydroxy acid dehydrogenase YdfG
MKADKKIALVTGGTSGIGFEIAKKLEDEGLKVIITGKSKNIDQDNYFNNLISYFFKSSLNLI